MAHVRDVMAYICDHYPHKHELSNSRLTKMIYLADWKSAIERRQTITNLDWKFDRYGPYVDTVAEIAREDPAFNFRRTINGLGNRKNVISLKNVDVERFERYEIDSEERKMLNQVIDATNKLNYDEFIKLVYSTYPVLTSARGTFMDLIRAANEYTKQRRLASGEKVTS